MAKRKQVISHRDFVRDLSRGHLGEDIVEEFLLLEFDLVADNVSKRNPDYDLIITKAAPKLSKGSRVVQKKQLRKIFKNAFGYGRKDDITVEVKFDEAAARYKNIFMEVFFDYETGSPGTMFKCKADIIAWVIPQRKKFKIYLFRRPELLAWFLDYLFTNKKKVSYKTPGISPHARGIPIPIAAVAASVACVGEFEYKL